MKDAQKPDHVSLTVLINRLREGRYVIPDFQREFEWKPWDIRELMRSIFLDYYIGSLLLWKGKGETFKALACETLYGFEGEGEPTHIVLDGQQRLTAMHYAFFAPPVAAPDRQNRFLYFIHVDRFMDEQYDDAFGYDWTSRTLALFENQEEQFRNHIFPLNIVGKGGWDLPNWVQGYERHWRERQSTAREAGNDVEANAAGRHADDAIAFGNHLKGITEQYQIAYIELDKDLELDKVCDIFTQINSRGIRLDVFDLINALLKPRGLQLKHMWREASSRLEFVDSARLNVYILQVMSILLQSYCSPKYLYYLLPGQERTVRGEDGALRKEVLVGDIEEFRERWDHAVDSLASAIALLRHPQEFGAISSQYLPYVSILPAFAALNAAVRALPSGKQFGALRKLRHWYWASVFTNRYSGSVESTAARDFKEVSEWFEEEDRRPSLISEFETRFRNLDFRKETKRGTSVYNGIFNLLVLKGARDWVSGTAPQHDDLDDHHIVPKRWGKEEKVGSAIDSILNRTPLTGLTNRNVIRDRLPNEYLPELVRQNGEDTVRVVMDSHFISPKAFEILTRDPFTQDDFEAFLAERQRTLQEAIEDLLIKERVGLAAPLREIDEEIENVELALRELLSVQLNGDFAQLPGHIQAKIRERTAGALRRNAALDEADLSTLSASLQFADLRELEGALTSKALWPRFEPTFRSKQALMSRFNQLAELRNAIRHSRHVDEVVRKEGEAAILWFQKVLPVAPSSLEEEPVG